MDGSRSGSCLVAGFDISCIESLGSATTVLITLTRIYIII
jgi:hypothetical protein